MIEALIEYIEMIATNPTVILFGAVTLIEVSPIKIDPWKWLFLQIGNALNSSVREDLYLLKTQQSELKKELEEHRAQDKRRHILEFANSCRRGEEHDREEWNTVITDIKDYETFVAEKKLNNGVIEETTKYLRELYHDRNVKNDFL